MFTRPSLNKTVLSALCLSLSLGLAWNSSAQAQNTPPENATESETTSEMDKPPSTELEVEATEEATEVEATEEVGDSGSEDTEPKMPVEAEGPDLEDVEESAVGSDGADTQTAQTSEALYQALETSLGEKAWENADRGTFDLLLALVGEQSKMQGYFSLEEWDKFVSDEASCADIKRIDELWKKASDDKLGFSAQKNIYEQDFNNAFFQNSRVRAFYFKIGWLSPERTVAWKRDSDKQTATDNAVSYLEDRAPDFANPVPGHLPAIMSWADDSDRRLYLFNKCGL